MVSVPTRPSRDERERGPERRVPGERQLDLRREDPDVVAVRSRTAARRSSPRTRSHARDPASSRRRGRRARQARRTTGSRRTVRRRTRRPTGRARASRQPIWALVLRSPVRLLYAGRARGCNSMAEFQPSKLAMRVRFPSPALTSLRLSWTLRYGHRPCRPTRRCTRDSPRSTPLPARCRPVAVRTPGDR